MQGGLTCGMQYCPRPLVLVFLIGLIISMTSFMVESSNDGSLLTSFKDRTPDELYKKHCRLCHGMDGKKMLSDAKDLSISELSLEDRIAIISDGNGSMSAYKDKMSTEEIAAVASYI